MDQTPIEGRIISDQAYLLFNEKFQEVLYLFTYSYLNPFFSTTLKEIFARKSAGNNAEAAEIISEYSEKRNRIGYRAFLLILR